MHIVRVRNGVVSAPANSPLVCTLGSFDGLHRGHRAVLESVVAASAKRACVPALMTFVPHPSVALGKIEKLPLITTLHQRVAFLESLGIQQLILVSFTRGLGSLTWQEFCDLYLQKLLPVKELIIGGDARVGKKAEGTAPLLKEYLGAKGCAVTILPFIAEHETKIASRTIRDAIAAGKVSEATTLLGRNFAYEGRVVHGDGRGRTIGFPSANISIGAQVVPKGGVYYGYAEVVGKRYEAVCNIGKRPTFGGKEEKIEVHILTKDVLDLYGERLTFSFVDRLRDEKRFTSVEELSTQIASDVAAATKKLQGE